MTLMIKHMVMQLVTNLEIQWRVDQFVALVTWKNCAKYWIVVRNMLSVLIALWWDSSQWLAKTAYAPWMMPSQKLWRIGAFFNMNGHTSRWRFLAQAYVSCILTALSFDHQSWTSLYLSNSCYCLFQRIVVKARFHGARNVHMNKTIF